MPVWDPIASEHVLRLVGDPLLDSVGDPVDQRRGGDLGQHKFLDGREPREAE